MERSRILAQLPPLLADLLRQLLDEGMELHPSAATSYEALIAEAARDGADVVVVAATDINQYRELSSDLGKRVLVVLHDRGRTGARYVDGRLELTSEDLSAGMLRELLRTPDG